MRKAALQSSGAGILLIQLLFLPPALSSHRPETPLCKEEQRFAAGGTSPSEQWLFPPELAAREELEGGKAAACIPALPPQSLGRGKSRQINSDWLWDVNGKGSYGPLPWFCPSSACDGFSLGSEG